MFNLRQRHSNESFNRRRRTRSPYPAASACWWGLSHSWGPRGAAQRSGSSRTGMRWPDPWRRWLWWLKGCLKANTRTHMHAHTYTHTHTEVHLWLFFTQYNHLQGKSPAEQQCFQKILVASKPVSKDSTVGMKKADISSCNPESLF